MNTAALLADAMTDYVLTAGVDRGAPAAGAPEHIAAWLEARGYRLVHRLRSAPRDAVPAGGCPVDHETGAGAPTGSAALLSDRLCRRAIRQRAGGRDAESR